MRTTKKVTLSAMLVALGPVVMILGAVINTLDLTVCAVASLTVVFAYLELGSPYTWLIWLCTSLATGLCFPGSVIWAEFLFVFGIYPLLKGYIERLPRVLWLPVKLVYINAVVLGLMWFVDKIFGTPLLDAETPIMKIILYVLINISFIAFDLFITVMVRVYFDKFRPKIKRLLK